MADVPPTTELLAKQNAYMHSESQQSITYNSSSETGGIHQYYLESTLYRCCGFHDPRSAWNSSWGHYL